MFLFVLSVAWPAGIAQGQGDAARVEVLIRDLKSSDYEKASAAEGELRKAEGLLGRLDESQRRAVESITSQIVNKLLHLPTVRMKQAAAAADGVIYAEAVRHLFGLGEDER